MADCGRVPGIHQGVVGGPSLTTFRGSDSGTPTDRPLTLPNKGAAEHIMTVPGRHQAIQDKTDGLDQPKASLNADTRRARTAPLVGGTRA